jgi:hypothetical protein
MLTNRVATIAIAGIVAGTVAGCGATAHSAAWVNGHEAGEDVMQGFYHPAYSVQGAERQCRNMSGGKPLRPMDGYNPRPWNQGWWAGCVDSMTRAG